jgi:hypothetical protein
LINNKKNKMGLLQKTWFRLVISLFGGGLVAETIRISTGDPNRPIEESSRILPLVYGLIIYIILTSVIRKYGKIK